MLRIPELFFSGMVFNVIVVRFTIRPSGLFQFRTNFWKYESI